MTRYELFYEFYGQILKSSKLFHMFSLKTIQELSLKMQEVIYIPNELVY